ncbi:MAG: N-acetylmuramoyl-L-alanine amidase [Acidaminococcus intestini]|jgi:hypothetical protein
MLKPTFIDYGLWFRPLQERSATDLLVIHHTGNPTDDDLSAEEIHESHLAQGWAGIGYHFVIRKDGTVEMGRPVDTVGAHAYGYNSRSIGIHVCGNFEVGEPTPEQIESCAILVAWLSEEYGVKVNRSNVVGHRDLMATACPGDNLYSQLQTIRGKVIWYQQHYGEDGKYHD